MSNDEKLFERTNTLLDNVINHIGLKNDAALARALEVSPPVISKLRHNRLPLGASLLIRIHEVTDWSIRDIKDVLGPEMPRCSKIISAGIFPSAIIKPELTVHKLD